MKAKDLKVGSVLEIEINVNPELTKKVQTKIFRCTDSYVWFTYMGLNRIGRGTIDKFPTLYKIISI